MARALGGGGGRPPSFPAACLLCPLCLPPLPSFLPSITARESRRPRPPSVARSLASSFLVLMAGRTTDAGRDGGGTERGAADELIRFCCLLIYPLLHAPRTTMRRLAAADALFPRCSDIPKRLGDRERDRQLHVCHASHCHHSSLISSSRVFYGKAPRLRRKLLLLLLSSLALPSAFHSSFCTLGLPSFAALLDIDLRK